MPLVLEGLRVIDVSQGVPGPLCAMMLGDLGAQVIKVEPLEGDWLRQIGPFVQGESALFIRLNRNKKGICLNLKQEKGKEVFRRLVQGADILIEGYRPSAMDKLGLSYESLAKSNRGLVYCSISAMGSQGPMAELPRTELDIQALAGKDRQLGLPGEPPLRVGYDIVSSNAAWAAGQGILAALFSRERTGGEGQRVETSLLDAAIAIAQWTIAAESNPDEWRGRPLSGYTEPPDHGYQCKDASFLLDVGRDDEAWKTFCTAVGAEHLATDPRFDDFIKRASDRMALQEALKPVLASWSFNDLRDLVQGMGGTIVLMHDFESLMNDPQVEALEIVKEMQHPVAGKYKTLDVPWDFSEPIARASEVPAPLLGQHTRELLSELGYKKAAISALLAKKAAA